MRVCGVELKGSEAIICLLNYDGEAFNVPECRQRVFTVSNSSEAENIRDFHFAFDKLMEDYKVDEIVIIERFQKGKFAGGATGFKLEAAIQLQARPVSLMPTKQIKEQLKRNPMQADFDALELKRFQKPAFDVAYTYQNTKIYEKN
ncbi:DUF3010 family protein [Parashewanella spongiae]|uniref:DUF3010 family protein n=1 Tax=Parashewanella spongiae TaxID=342950 RepID=A0A3A6UA72_9GAMM|nr:DUF3010 family protein [Parashewanella spongiae]MCL1077842.1 DUF3010 family protein [Parashewanella spongiae]RJY18861.1 DUF3010 family protein [Parashewanella spongiae]